MNDREANQTKRDLDEAFWNLYTEKDVNRISIRELTETAGYNRGTFYLHYKDIYDLLERQEQTLLSQMDECISSCPVNPSKKDLFALMTRILGFYQRNRKQLVVLLGERGDASFTRKLKSSMKRMPIWRVSNPDLNVDDAMRDLLLEQTVAGVLAMIGSWLEDSRGVSAPSLLHAIYSTAIKK